MKKAYSFRLDEDLVSRAREQIGPRGFTELIERLLSEHLVNGSGERVSRQEGDALPDSDSATTSRGETTAPPGPPDVAGSADTQSGGATPGGPGPAVIRGASPVDHVHVWKKNIGSSGLVTRRCECGEIQ